MVITRVWLGVFAAFLAATAAAAAPPASLATLEARLHDIAAKNHIPGAGIVLVADGKVVWCGGVGLADIAARRAVTCDTEFRIGSASKSLVALALLKLAEDGKLDLHARLHDVAPEIPVDNPWEATDPVRIDQVLEHTAGFDDSDFADAYSPSDTVRVPVLRFLERHPGPLAVRWPPGRRMSYSNAGYGVAGYLVEKASGRPWAEYIRETILRPIGITTGDFALTSGNRALLAQGYGAGLKPASPYRFINLAPAGEMKASPREMALLLQVLIDRGLAGSTRVLKPESIARMEWPQSSDAARYGLRHGYGFGNYTGTDGGVLSHGHNGGLVGFSSNYRYSAEQKSGFAVLVNSDSTGGAEYQMSDAIAGFLSRGWPHPKPAVVKLAAAELQRYAGLYDYVSPRRQLFAFLEVMLNPQRVAVADGKLVIFDFFGGKEVLLPAGKNLFRHDWESQATAVFYPAADGTMIMSNSGTFERTCPVWPYVRIGLPLLALVLMASGVLFAPVWLLRWAVWGLKGKTRLAARALPLVAVFSFAGMFVALAAGGEDVFSIGPAAETFFALSILFALLSVAGLWFAVRGAGMDRFARTHAVLIAAACCVLAGFMVSWHLIGLRLWTV